MTVFINDFEWFFFLFLHKVISNKASLLSHHEKRSLTRFLRSISIVRLRQQKINYGLVMISCALVRAFSCVGVDFCGARGILSIFQLASCNVVGHIFSRGRALYFFRGGPSSLVCIFVTFLLQSEFEAFCS